MNTRLFLLIGTLLGLTLPSDGVAGEFPIPLGAGSDSVFLKTGVSPDWEKRMSFHQNLSAAVAYDGEMKVREITVSPLLGNRAADQAPSLQGVSLSDRKEDVIQKLGKPTAEFPKQPDESTDTHRLVWVSEGKMLIISFWSADQKDTKYQKDTVAFMQLRVPNL